MQVQGQGLRGHLDSLLMTWIRAMFFSLRCKSLQFLEGRSLCKALLPLHGMPQRHIELHGLGQGFSKSLILNTLFCIELPEASLGFFQFWLGFWVEGPLQGRGGFGVDVHWLCLLPLHRPSPFLSNSVVLTGGLWSLSLPIRHFYSLDRVIRTLNPRNSCLIGRVKALCSHF